MDITKLEEIGLTHNEALTFTALLETGETKTGALVKKTGLHRVLIYDALESLIKKGLASYVIKENIKYFQAADPQRLLDFLKEKEETVKTFLPELALLQQQAATQQQVSVYEGIRGLKSAMNNMLKELTSKDYHYVFASGNMADTMGPYYSIYQKTKEEKKIMTHIIYDVSFRKRTDVTKITYGKIRFFPLTPFPTDTWIYKDKVLIVTYTAKPPIAILIVSQETANSYKKIFEQFWTKAKD
jgi:sugar-specific transcriptional regulator TrmB